MSKTSKTHVKKGDDVVITTGNSKGHRGKIIEVIRKKDRVIVEGANLIKKHTKRSQQNPEGSIVEREGTVHISNVMKVEVFEGRRQRKAELVRETRI